MNCEETRTRIAALVEGTLAGETARGVRSHLAGCRRCAESLAVIDRVELLPAFDEAIEPSADLGARFRARLETHREETARARDAASVGGFGAFWRAVRSWSVPRQLLAAGALAGFLAFGIYLGIHREAQRVIETPPTEIQIAQNLPLLRDMQVIENLDLLEDFDAIQSMPEGRKPSTIQ